MSPAIGDALADFRGVVGSGTAHTEAGYVWITVAFEENSYLYAFDVAQETREVVVHVWCSARYSQGGVGGLRPDEAPIAGGLRVGDDEGRKPNWSEGRRAADRWYNGSWAGSGRQE